jgi:hypothetical protein
VYRVRVIEGFSGEEGIPDDFGLTEADGAILLGEAPVVHDGDNSFAAFVPEDRPLHLQTLDRFGMSMLNEDRWFSAAAGEQRFCGGCHEERGGSQIVSPGISDAMGQGPANLGLAYEERRLAGTSLDSAWADMVGKLMDPDDEAFAAAERIRGIPWNQAVQSVFTDAACDTCHDGSQSQANPCVNITNELDDGTMSEPVMWCFDLRGEEIEFTYGMMTGNYSRSHISTLLMAGMAGEEGVEVTPVDPTRPYQAYMVPQSARDSVLIKYIQPGQVYPTANPDVLAFDGVTDETTGHTYEAQHPNANTPGYVEGTHRALTPQEKYLLILAADLGGQYYSLENAPGQDGYGN